MVMIHREGQKVLADCGWRRGMIEDCVEDRVEVCVEVCVEV